MINMHHMQYHVVDKAAVATQLAIAMYSNLYIATVELPIMDPPTRGQPLNKGHRLWHRLKLL